jgi:uncharacterized protein with FMN-binding domain
MRKVLLALLLTAVGLGLLLSFKSRPGSGASALGGSTLSGSNGSGNSTSATTPAPPSASATPTPSGGTSTTTKTTTTTTTAKTSSGAKSGTFTGASEQTRYGAVQVAAVISGGKLTNVTVLQVPDNGGYEDQIVSVAVPELKSEALSAQSANIQVVSGATYTSQGYAQSLQSALDQAGL